MTKLLRVRYNSRNMDYLSVKEAAEALGVAPQRVRALVGAGRLPGQRLGRAWAIASRDLEAARSRRVGRPLAAANVWALLVLLDGSFPDWIGPAARSRLRKRASDRDWVEAALRHSEPRSIVHEWRVLASDLERIVDSYPLVRAGLSADDAGIDVVPVGVELDAYVRRPVVSSIRRMVRPLEAADGPNLVLRVPSHDWILLHQERAPSSVVAADLLDHPDPRVARAARRLLRELPE